MESQRLKKISQTVGAAIASHRVRVGLTQEDVAERLGIGNEAISRLERGIVLPSIPRLSELAELFECRMDELLLTSSDRKTDQAATIEAHLSGLSPEDRAFVVDQARATAGYLRGRANNGFRSTISSPDTPSTGQQKKNAKKISK